ncbi:hypothetical protein AB6A40_005202 [Gnathostoma spinigerum]|uniref:AAA+ ATPase domain-containing protein n=1 Tax=Gnathostoma spinigerum TaxID=75299 RepID=A0ABD6ENE0_9BILA
MKTESYQLISSMETLSVSDGLLDSIPTIHAEIRMRKGICKDDVEKHRSSILSALYAVGEVSNWHPLSLNESKGFSHFIDHILIGTSVLPHGAVLSLTEETLPNKNLHIYRIRDYGPEAQEVSADSNSDEVTVGSQHWELPCKEFDQIWENLIFDDDVKNELLSYIYAALRLSDRGADFSILRVNRLILLHGPPGTGKTSLCKGLAQKLAIRLGDRYIRSVFVEINSHSLFSKWFSESGKLVLKMFDQIEELAEDGRTLVFVLIDEVESLSMARSGAFNRNEPADAIRAVNALLTQIDRIRRLSNVLVLTTSNISKMLDEAFIDRADLCRYIGQPSLRAVYSILLSCIHEMQRIGIVARDEVIEPPSSDGHSSLYSQRLLEISKLAVGLSGRCLRQLPVLAYSKLALDSLTINQCLSVFEKAIVQKIASKDW